MSGYERVKRWREKNRALVNLRQREYRRRAKVDNLIVKPNDWVKNKIEDLRELIARESDMPVTTPVAVPAVFRDDYGRVISETQWKRLQERKAMAKDGGYELDEYSQ